MAPSPVDPLRAAYLRWMFFAADPLEEPTATASMGFEIPDNMRGRLGYGSLKLVMDALEGALRPGPFLLGDRFSAVDVYLGGKLSWALTIGAIEKRPVFEAYVARVTARPAAIRASDIDNALAKPPAG